MQASVRTHHLHHCGFGRFDRRAVGQRRNRLAAEVRGPSEPERGMLRERFQAMIDDGLDQSTGIDDRWTIRGDTVACDLCNKAR